VLVSGFEWDDGNFFHIERHEFTPEEVEEVFAGDYRSGGLARSYMLQWVQPLRGV
jgi:hypothetical protein